ncbi:hypothetical protein H4S07_007016, partial [Coemansia furcata]
GNGSDGSLEGGNGNGQNNGGGGNGGGGNGGDQNNGGNSNNSGNNGTGGSLGSNSPQGDASALNSSGMSRGATIAVAIVVPIVTILIMVGLFYAYKWWRRRQNVINWDPKNERANLDQIRIIDQITPAAPSPVARDVTPPSYFEHEFESIFNPV